MITALIFAGGTGQRMNASDNTPKQFLKLHGKPIIVYTLEHFEKHSEVDNIIVVCLESWISEFKLMIEKYDIKKVINVVPGGSGGDKSIYNGLKALDGICSESDIVLIHDGVRPLINAELISANIATAKEYGTAITAEPLIESAVQSKDGVNIDYMPSRAEMYTAKAPQSFRFGLIRNLYQRAQDEGIGTIDSSHLCSIYGVSMRMVKSTKNNIKITAPYDYYIFRALYEAMENRQLRSAEYGEINDDNQL